jgi:tetratricopeptide (TPR) repeat protein
VPFPSPKSPCLRTAALWTAGGLTALFCAFKLSLGANAVTQQEDEALATARSLIQENKNQEAIARLKALAARRPGTKGVNRELGIAYYHQADYLEAATYLEHAWRENPEDRDAAQLLGLSYYFSGKPAQAIPALEKFRLWHPNANIDAIYILGLCYILTRDYPQALETFARLYHLNSDSAAAHLMLGRILLRQGFDPVAEQEVHKALALSPRLPLAHFTLGEFWAYGADYPRAAQEFQQELEINPGYAPAFSHLGDAYWRLKRYEDAERVLQGSIWLDATSAEPYVILGKVFMAKRQSAEAERALQRAIAVDSGNYTAHYFLGQLYREQGKADAAEREMKIAAQIQQLQAQNAPRIR